MGTYGMFEMNAKLEKDGVLLDFGTGGRFRIARAGGSNTEFIKAYNEIMQPHRRAIEAGLVDKKLLTTLTAKVYAKTILKGWEDVTGRDGQLLTFSAETCEALLLDLPELFLRLQSASMEIANFRQELVDNDAKN